MESETEKVVKVFLAIVFTPILLLLLLYVFHHIYKSAQRSKWPIAKGQIEESSIQHDHDLNPYLALRYKFFVDDQPYWGDQDIVVRKRNKADELLASLPIGQQIEIRFNPEDPETESELANWTQG